MRHCWMTLVVLLLCVTERWVAAGSPDIPARIVGVPTRSDLPQAIPLINYWRGNVRLANGALVDHKQRYQHVPTLVEYNLEFEQGGEYELQAKFVATAPSPTKLTLDGEELGMVFAEAADRRGQWSPLVRFAVRPGVHRLRFTSQYVETPFPMIHALQLAQVGARVPEPKPTPKVVGYRAALPKDWWKTISRKIHGDFHTGGFVRGVGKQFKPDEYADTLAKNGINAICVFAKGHHGYAYYNTKVGTRHPGLDFDLMKAQIEACHRRGIAVWVYLSIAVDELYGSTLAAQPEQRGHFLNVNAAVDTHYVRDYTWPMVVECVRDYDIDGFFFDFPGNEAFVQETLKLIKSIKPGVAVAYNHQWDKSRDELAQLDILEIESWMHKQTLYHWQYVARYARGAVPLTAMNTRFWIGWGDFGGIADEAKLRFDVATGLANGCAITIGDQLHPFGRLDPAVYERIGKAMKYAQRVEPYVFGAESVPYVALLKQSETACHALVDGGLHFTVVDTSQELAPFKAVVIPDGSKLDAEYVAKLERYVQAGGKLLVTGRPTPELARLLGVTLDPRVADEPAHLRLAKQHFPTPPCADVYSYQPMTHVKPTDGARELAPLVWALNHGTNHHVSHRHSPAMDTPSGYAAATWRTVGTGAAVYVAAPAFEIYARMGYTVMREIAVDLIHKLVPPPQRIAEVRAPASVEVSVTRQGKRLIVHLVHCAQSRRVNATTTDADNVHKEPILDGVTTLSGVELRLPAGLVNGKTIRTIVGARQVLKPKVMNGVASITLPDFQIATVLVME